MGQSGQCDSINVETVSRLLCSTLWSLHTMTHAISLACQASSSPISATDRLNSLCRRARMGFIRCRFSFNELQPGRDRRRVNIPRGTRSFYHESRPQACHPVSMLPLHKVFPTGKITITLIKECDARLWISKLPTSKP